jgi:hypothetical protein
MGSDNDYKSHNAGLNNMPYENGMDWNQYHVGRNVRQYNEGLNKPTPVRSSIDPFSSAPQYMHTPIVPFSSGGGGYRTSASGPSGFRRFFGFLTLAVIGLYALGKSGTSQSAVAPTVDLNHAGGSGAYGPPASTAPNRAMTMPARAASEPTTASQGQWIQTVEYGQVWVPPQPSITVRDRRYLVWLYSKQVGWGWFEIPRALAPYATSFRRVP